VSDDVYRELARTLDRIPPGFPATESGVELQLLARLFTRDEATVVTALRLTYEAAGDIAARAAMDSGAAYDILNGAVRMSGWPSTPRGEAYHSQSSSRRTKPSLRAEFPGRG
jgi:hypothetical protein